MQSIFDEEEGPSRSTMLLPASRAMEPVHYEPTQKAPSYIPPSSALNLVYGSEKTSKRKPTKLEAIQKLAGAPPPSAKGLPYGVQRIVRKPIMVYQGAWLLAGGLILIDPLDRTEGLY